MPAPSVDYAGATVYNSATTPKALAVTDINAGDVVVAIIGMENDGSDSSMTDDGGLAPFTVLYNPGGGGLAGHAKAFGKVATGSIATDNLSFSGAGGLFFGASALRASGTDGIGASTGKSVTVNEAGTVSLTTTQDNSAILVSVVDWNSLDGATRTWATVNGTTPTAGNGFEIAYFRNTSNYAVYSAFYPDAGTAGAKTVGVTTPGATMRPAVAAIEVLGSTGGGGPPPAIMHQYMSAMNAMRPSRKYN